MIFRSMHSNFFVSPTKCTILIIQYIYIKGVTSNMSQYKCTIFRENKMPVLKPTANDKLLFARSFHL